MSSEEKVKHTLCKLRSTIQQLRQSCFKQARTKFLSVDEQMVPFSGRVGIRQYISNKPYFKIREGEQWGIEEEALLKLTTSLKTEHMLYFDRHFTTLPLIEELRERGFGAS